MNTLLRGSRPTFHSTLAVAPVVVAALLVAVVPAAPASLVAQLPGPTLILEDSVVLEETDNIFLGQPIEMFIGVDGAIFVIDGYSNSVAHFDLRGRQVRTYGEPGRGPGEFSYIGVGASAGDVLAVVDGFPPKREIEFFDLKSGAHLGVAEVMDATALAQRRGRLWVGGIDSEEWKLLGVARTSRLTGRGDGKTRRHSISLDRVDVPRVYRESEAIRNIGSLVRLAVGKDDAIVGVGASGFLLRVGENGELLDTLPLQAARRRGVPEEDEFIKMMADTDETPRREVLALTSTLMNVSRSGEHIFTVHQDTELHDGQLSGKLYVSSLDGSGGRQCPDTLVPTSDAARPVSAFNGDQLFVLDQRIGEGGMGDLRSVVRRFKVVADDCTGVIRRRGQTG